MDLTLAVTQYLGEHGKAKLVAHVARVAREGRRLAEREGVDPVAAETAGWLHDVSLVMPYSEMLGMARARGITVLPEEAQVPALLHGKLSASIAAESFGVTDSAVLAAMGCHTTLRAGASPLDQVLFVADKLGWDPADAPYREGLAAALERSLAEGVRYFLAWAWEGRRRMPVIHPWFRAACAEYLHATPDTRQ